MLEEMRKSLCFIILTFSYYQKTRYLAKLRNCNFCGFDVPVFFSFLHPKNRERNHYRQTHSIPFGHPALSEKWQLFDTPEFSETASVFGPNGTPNSQGDEVTKSTIFVILHLGEFGVSLLSPLASPRFRFAVLPLAGQRLPFSLFLSLAI